jgi:hypothetical protein
MRRDPTLPAESTQGQAIPSPKGEGSESKKERMGRKPILSFFVGCCNRMICFAARDKRKLGGVLLLSAMQTGAWNLNPRVLQ